MKKHFCTAEKTVISYEGECNWCGEKDYEGIISELTAINQKLIKTLEEIANDYPELSHDKARMQNLDHIKWAKAVLRETSPFHCNGFCGEQECKDNQANCMRGSL